MNPGPLCVSSTILFSLRINLIDMSVSTCLSTMLSLLLFFLSHLSWLSHVVFLSSIRLKAIAKNPYVILKKNKFILSL